MPVPAGANPPFNPGASGVPSAAAPTPDTGDVATDIQIAAGQNPMGYQFKEPMTTGQRLSALGMVLSAAGTPDFARVAGTVQAGITQRTQGIDKYNRDLRALTTEQTELVVEDGLYKNKHTPASYKMSADGKGIEFIGNATPYFTEIEGGDFREPKDPTKREIKVDGDGNQRFVDDGSYVFDDQIPDPSASRAMTSEARGTTARYVNELYEKRVAPLEDAIDKADMAVSYADVYYETDDTGKLTSTKAQRTQADRALIKAVEKLWDANSAVLQGEFEAAENAQDVVTQLQRGADPTSGEVLGDESRAAMLDIIQRASGDMMDKYNRGAEEVYLSAQGGFNGYENYDNNMQMAIPQLSRWMNGEEFAGRQQSDSWAGLNESEWYQAALNRANTPPPPGDLDKQAEALLRANAGKFGNKAGRPLNVIN